MGVVLTRNFIIDLAKVNDGIVTKKEVTEKLGHTYYYNGDKHLGEILSNMVKNGLLERTKNGVFRLIRTNKVAPVQENQTLLF